MWKTKYKKNSGFTLLEMLLSVSILALLAVIATPVYQSFQVRNDLEIAKNVAIESLRRAQTLSQSGVGDSAWGVYFSSGDITIFKGPTFATRSLGFDELFDVPASISGSGLSEVVFSKLEGLPSATGTITLTSNTNETRNITINTKGMVDF